ncbi:hypothetical protein [Methanobrevibacter sp.]|uniref:hypothetical protein n=1 Tax=Methanobrevibacter sp. TaxID=66852 RepID=UPI00388F8052
MKYTTTSLIEVLSKFPKDLEIDTELSFLFNYPKELDHLTDTMTRNEFIDLARSKATNLCLLEGSWEDGTIPREKIMGIQEKWGKMKK